MKKVRTEEAEGLELAYDITEINPETGFKGRAFRRGHIIRKEDIEHLLRLGRTSVFIWDGTLSEVHEDDAAIQAAPLIAGENISFDEEPVEGKISFYADTNGLFKVDVQRLYDVNILGVPSLPTIHTDLPVKKGQRTASFRIIPLTCPQDIFDKMKAALSRPVISVKPYVIKNAAILVTGDEVYQGRIKDKFIPVLSKKLAEYGVEVAESEIVPDDKELIARKIKEFSGKCGLVLTTGGTSVDPDDVTFDAIRDAGVEFEVKGNPIQPGNNMTIGYIKDVPVCAVPAAAVMIKTTALDIYLPRLLAGEKITRHEIARLGHGGLCHFCDKCVYPVCPFGRG